MHKQFLTYLIFLFILSSCASYEPFYTERVTKGVNSKVKQELTDLPAPTEKIVAAVYRFKDQTGQYKASDRIASWSTAVTQGATSILIKAMEDSGWFIPIEREGLSNLLNERQIIQQIRAQNAGTNNVSPLPPLLYAGVMLEGGIVGYDTNIMTGGVGARYFGTGANTQFRKDQITIYLRAVSTQSGRVLKTVHTTKSILSQQLESGVFRFVDSNRLLESEAGYTYNEPPVLAVTEAIDEAVKLLVLEGIEENLWATADTTAYADYLAEYENTLSEPAPDYFGFSQQNKRTRGLNMSLSYIHSGHIGNYDSPVSYSGVQLSAEKFLTRSVAVEMNAFRTGIGARNVFEDPISGLDLGISMNFVTNGIISPFISLGGSVLAYDQVPDFADQQFFPAAYGSAGFRYEITPRVDLKAGVQYRYMLDDGIDGFRGGNINDQYWNLTGGLIFKNLF